MSCYFSNFSTVPFVKPVNLANCRIAGQKNRPLVFCNALSPLTLRVVSRFFVMRALGRQGIFFPTVHNKFAEQKFQHEV